MKVLTTPDLKEVQDLYERGLYVQAYEASKAFGPLETWRGVDGRILAGRLAGNLGSNRLTAVLHRLALRENPGHAWATCFCARTMLARWGPYFALRWMQRQDQSQFEQLTHLSEWAAMHGVCHAMLRDRKRADDYISQAYDTAPDLPWLAVEHAAILEYTDRYEQALEVTQQSLLKKPDYRPAVQSVAHLLVLAGKDEQATELLQDAITRLESGALHCQLGSMLRQSQRLEEAREQYELGAQKMPLMEQTAGDAWLARIRCDLASACGDADEAYRLLEPIPDRYKGYFHKQVQEALENRPADATRRELNVPFIRQHHRTCAPATMAMLSRFWDKQAEHLEIAEAICFDGTPYHAERNWAQGAGYLVAEFTIDMPTSIALIDRGLPYTLSTVEPGSGHLQAVIGYDTSRSTLLLRDPFYPTVGEILAHSLPKRYGAYGPRGMVMVPQDQAHLLYGIDLPDRQLWDHSHALRCALIDHKRDEAAEHLAQMQELDKDNTVTLNAELSLADYDNDATSRDRLVQALLERYPECPAILPRRLACLSEQGLRHKRLELLREACERDDAPGLLRHRLAAELAQDAKDHGRADWQLRRLIRSGYQFADAYESLGSLYWTLGKRDEATNLYHIAACIEDKREAHAMTLFRAQRYHRREQETLAFLRERFDRLGDKDAGPARTLYEAHRMMARADLGFEVLEEAIERRPDDGRLLLFAAEEMSAFGKAQRAQTLLEQAKSRCHPDDWRFAASTLAEDGGQLIEAREHMQAVLDQSPLNIAAHRRWCGITRRLEGPTGVLEHLHAAVERFPHHWDLQQTLYFELAEIDPPAAQQLLREMLQLLPNNAWAWRELGFAVVEHPDGLKEAHQAAKRAYELDPTECATFNLIGRVAERSGDTEKASKAYRKAIRLDPDAVYAIQRLVDVHDDRASRRKALHFVFTQLSEQVTLGDGVLTYQSVAGRARTADEVLADLRTAVDARPDLWQTWAALVDQLLLADALDEAPKIAEEATSRFPLIPAMWLRRAEVHRVRLEQDDHLRCLDEVLRISPDYSSAVHQLMLAHQNAGQLEQAEQVVRRALDRNPRNAGYFGGLADLLWNTNRPEEALKQIEQAVRLAPDYSWAWDHYIEWAHRMGQPNDPGDVARELTNERPAEAGVWLNLAHVLHQREDLDERLAAIDLCTKLNPQEAEAYDLKAQLLVQAHRFDEARAACEPSAYKGRQPINLRGRACWVDYERGETDRAIQSLWKIIEDEPRYIWALKTMVSWCVERDDTAGQIKASDMLLAVDPNDQTALGYRAWAKLRQADQPGLPDADVKKLAKEAKADLERAIALDPGYAYGAERLFNIQLLDDETDQAQQTLRRTAPFLPPETRLSREIALACKFGQRPEAIALLKELCKTPTDQPDVFDYAYDHADKLGIARQVFAEMSTDPQSNPLIAEQIVRPLINEGQWKRAENALKRLRNNFEAWDYAAGYLFNLLGNINNQTLRDFTRGLYRRNRKPIARSKHAWNGAVYALANMNLDRDNIALFGDWRRRENLEPWMLCNLANAFLATGKIEDAQEVIRHALSLPPDHSVPRHLVDLAHCQALIGDAKTAQEILESIALVQLPDEYQYEYHLAAALASAKTAGDAGTGRQLAEQHLQQAYELHPRFKDDRGARRSHLRILWALAREAGPLGVLRYLPRFVTS